MKFKDLMEYAQWSPEVTRAVIQKEEQLRRIVEFELPKAFMSASLRTAIKEWLKSPVKDSSKQTGEAGNSLEERIEGQLKRDLGQYRYFLETFQYYIANKRGDDVARKGLLIFHR